MGSRNPRLEVLLGKWGIKYLLLPSFVDKRGSIMCNTSFYSSSLTRGYIFSPKFHQKGLMFVPMNKHITEVTPPPPPPGGGGAGGGGRKYVNPKKTCFITAVLFQTIEKYV